MIRTTNPIRQALIVWGIFFFCANLLLNGTIQFASGADMRAWQASMIYKLLYGLIQYGCMFLVVPLVLIKGWKIVLQPGFLIPLAIAVVAITFSLLYRGVMAIALLMLLFLHWRFDLSSIGIRMQGNIWDLSAVLLLGVIYAIPTLTDGAVSLDWSGAWIAGLDRWLANPASSVENMFYFGFLTERLEMKTGRWLTPLLIGTMYTAHELTNPGYWYRGMNFPAVFVGITLCASIYLWRRNAVVVWLGDGLSRLLGKLL